MEEDSYVYMMLKTDKFFEDESIDEPYDPSCGNSKAQWERQRRNKKRLIKQERKEYQAYTKLTSNSPTWDILRKLDVVTLDGCV